MPLERAQSGEAETKAGVVMLRDVTFSAISALAVVSLFAGRLTLGGVRILPVNAWMILLPAAFVFWLLFSVMPARTELRTRYPLLGQLGAKNIRFIPEVFFALFVLLLFTEFPNRQYAFFEWNKAKLLLLAAGTLLLVVSLVFKQSLKLFFSLPVLILMQVVLAVIFLHFAGGRLIFNDDHPSFLYRLQLLKEHFPWIPFYNVEWNGGASAREFFPSGVLSVFFSAFPLVYFSDYGSFDGARAYTLLIPYLFVGLLPLAVYAAALVLRLGRSAAVLAGVFALAPSLALFEWGLKYGTLGFACSAGLMPLLFALAYRLALDESRPRASHLFFLLVVATLCSFWTPSMLAFLPFLFAPLFCWSVLWARRGMIAAFVLLFLLINGPWIAVFVEESKVTSFIASSSLPGTKVASFPVEGQAKDGHKKKHASAVKDGRDVKDNHLLKASKKAAALFSKTNPLLLLFFLPGLAAIPDKRLRRLLAATVVWLLLLAVVGEEFRPQLEFRRMGVPASYLLCLIAAAGISGLAFKLHARTCSKGGKAWCSLLVLSFLLGSIVFSPFVAAAAYRNRTSANFIFSSGLAGNLSKAIAEHGGEGRVFFFGFILHELEAEKGAQNGGHVAPLALLSRKPLYASQFYHSRWSYVEPIPSEYLRRRAEGIEEFLDLMNVTAVVTFKRDWVKYCTRSPRYVEVFREGRFRVFKRKADRSTYFLSGEGNVREGKEGIIVQPRSSEAVLKFRWLPKLKTNDPRAQLQPVFAFSENHGSGRTEPYYFINLRVSSDLLNEGKEITIGYR